MSTGWCGPCSILPRGQNRKSGEPWWRNSRENGSNDASRYDSIQVQWKRLYPVIPSAWKDKSGTSMDMNTQVQKKSRRVLLLAHNSNLFYVGPPKENIFFDHYLCIPCAQKVDLEICLWIIHLRATSWVLGPSSLL